MARYVFTAARRAALKKTQRARRGRRLSGAARAAALRNLKKARAALRRKGRGRVRARRTRHVRRSRR